MTGLLGRLYVKTHMTWHGPIMFDASNTELTHDLPPQPLSLPLRYMLDFALHPASGFGNIDGSNRSANPLNPKANRHSDRHRRRIFVRLGRCDLSVPPQF